MRIDWLLLVILIGAIIEPRQHSVSAQDAETLPFVVVGLGESAKERIAAVRGDERRRKLYVGMLSRDEQRRGLLVYDIDAQGTLVGEPRRYSDHPDPLPAGQHSTVATLWLDEERRLLFLGPQSSQPKFSRGVVMYELDEKGEPRGAPHAFDSGNPHHVVDAFAPHPTLPTLFAVGWGGEGVFALGRDEQGRIVGGGRRTPFGSYGAHSIALRADGSRLYRGTYPSVVDVCQLDAQGQLVLPPRSTSIPGGPQEYLRFVARPRGLYFAASDRSLQWLPLDAAGDVSGPARTTSIQGVQSLAATSLADRIVVAVDSTFRDAIDGKAVTQGVEVQEWQLNDDGTPGRMVRRSKPILRAAATALSGGPLIAIGVKPLGQGFLGNRLAGVKVRATLVSLEADGDPLPAAKSLSLGEEKSYLRFAVSRKHRRAYAVVDEQVRCVELSGNPKLAAGTPVAAHGPVAVDEQRGLLFAAQQDGSLAQVSLNAEGNPTGAATRLPTSLSTVERIVVDARTGIVYAIGIERAPPVAANSAAPAANQAEVISIPAGLHVSDAAIHSELRRLYVVSAYHGQKNLTVWQLDERGRLAGREPVRVADGIPYASPDVRGVLTSVRVDAARKRLLVTGAPENSPGSPAHLVVHLLDATGLPAGVPQVFPSANGRGSCLSVALTEDGNAWFEAGWGEPNIYAHDCDERLAPRGKPRAMQVGEQGKRQLEIVELDTRRYLLAGTFPSTLDVIPLQQNATPAAGANVEVTVDTLRRPLGRMSAGDVSDWIDLDTALRGGEGTSVVRCTLQGAPVRKAVVRWEVAQGDGPAPAIVRSVDVPIEGNVAALLVPKYGTDDPTSWRSQVRTTAEAFRQYRDWARKYAGSPSERPQKLLVANGLIGLDSSPEALDLGLETLELLGHNSAQIWSWPGMKPEAIRAAAERHGIRHFREAVYNPPSYFHYNVELVRPESLDKWAAGFRDAAGRMGATPEQLRLIHMADEPGWYFPHCTDEVAGDRRALFVFHEYLRQRGMTPELLGAANWEQVRPGRLSDTASLPRRRLFYWTTRFYAESLSMTFADATQALQRQIGPHVLTTTNLNNWPGRFYLPSPGKKIANNADAGPDAGMGMPDWFDLGRKRAVTCIWTEDWFGDADAQLWSLYGDLLRCAAREGKVEYGGYVVGHSTGEMPDGATLKTASLVAHGAKTIDPYVFGPNLAFGDGWSEKEAAYRNLADALRFVARGERLVAPGRPLDGSVAIVFPQASQVWDGDATTKAYLQELYGLHAAFIHEQFTVDFVDDVGLEQGELARRGYKTVFVTAPNLSRRAQEALRAWASAGGTLVLSPGACLADEYNESLDVIRSGTGIGATAVPRVAPPHHSQAYRAERVAIRVEGRAGQPATAAFAISQVAPIPTISAPARTHATFADGALASASSDLGQGRVVSLGFWPGVSYWLSPDRRDVRRLPQGWSSDARQFITQFAKDAGAARRVTTNHAEVEACVLESPQGWAVTLLNWSGAPITDLEVDLTQVAGARALPGDVSLESVQSGRLVPTRSANRVKIHLPLKSADVVLIQ